MGYPAGAQNDSRAPWNEVPVNENAFEIPGFVSSWDGIDVHKVHITGHWIEVDGRKCVISLQYTYPEGQPVKKPVDADYEVREAVIAELGGRVTFNIK